MVGGKAGYVSRFIFDGFFKLTGLSFSRQIKRPSLSQSKNMTPIYYQAPPQLEERTRPNLEKMVSELVAEGEQITVTSSTLPFNMSLRVKYV